MLHVFIDFPYGGDFAERGFLLLLSPHTGGFPLIGLAAALIGGVLPAVLTLREKIRTDKYLIIRLIVIVVIFGVNRFIRNLLIDGATDVTYFTLYMIVNVSAVLIQILMRKKQDTPPGEMAVLILSDPILWWAIYYFAFYMEIFFLF